MMSQMSDQERYKKLVQQYEHQLQFKRAQRQALNEVIQQLEEGQEAAIRAIEDEQLEVLPGLNDEDEDGAA